MSRALLLAISLVSASLSAQFTGFWENRPPLNIARQEVGAAVLSGKIYVSGGILANRTGTPTVEVLDPATRRWGRIADMPRALHHHGFCAAGGKLFQIGGYVGGSFSPTSECNVWDPATNRWSRIADLPRARAAFVAVPIGGKIYVAGGVEQVEGVSNTLAIYDIASNRWTAGSRMATRREHLAAAELGGKLYVVGGRRFGNTNVLECYDPATNRWATLRPMPTARGGNAAAALNGKLLCIGGEAFSPNKVFPETEEYDPTTNTWRRLRDMSVPVHGINAVVLGDEMVVAGGGLRAGFSTTTAVTAFRYLPTGVTRYGRTTPACNGAIRASVSEAPLAGANTFAFASSANAPPSTAGLLVLGATPDVGGRLLLGFRLHVGLAGLIALPAPSDASGGARLVVPLPSAARGARLFSQFVFANTASCRGSGPFSASDALDTTVR